MQYIDLEKDTLVPVQEICRERFGKRMSLTTVWRWVRKGCRGVKLEAVMVSGRWWTTPAAFAGFISERTAVALRPRNEVVDATDEELRAAGLL